MSATLATCCGASNEDGSYSDVEQAGPTVTTSATMTTSTQAAVCLAELQAQLREVCLAPEMQAQLKDVVRQTIRAEFERFRSEQLRSDQAERVRAAIERANQRKPWPSKQHLDAWSQSAHAPDDSVHNEDVTLDAGQQPPVNRSHSERGVSKQEALHGRQKSGHLQEGSPVRAMPSSRSASGLQLPADALRRASTRGTLGGTLAAQHGGERSASCGHGCPISEISNDEIRLAMDCGPSAAVRTPSHCITDDLHSEVASRDRSEEEKHLKNQWHSHMRQQLGQNLKSMRTRGLHHAVSSFFGKEWMKHHPKVPQSFAKPEPETCLQKVVDSNTFHAVCGIIIVLNSIFIGIRSDLCMRHALSVPPLEDPSWLPKVDLVFVLIFFIEVAFRIAAKRLQFFTAHDKRWNLFDLLVLMASMWEEVIHPWLYAGDKFSLTYIRLLGGLRMVRELRVIRVMRFFSQLRLMVCSIIQSLFSLTWALVLLMLIMYIFTISFMHAVTVHLHSGTGGMRPEYHTYYGSVITTMYSLTLAISGGQDWENLVQPLSEISSVYTLLYCFYVLFVIMGVLNVLTSAFVQRACELSKLDRDLVIQSELASNESFRREMSHIFDEVDVDDAGRITWENFRKFLQNDDVQAYFATQKLDVSDARDLFCLLDTDGDGHVELEEFVMGCKRLRGNAKSSDVATLLLESKRSNRKYTRALQRIEQQVSAICGALGGFEWSHVSYFGSPNSRINSPNKLAHATTMSSNSRINSPNKLAHAATSI